MSSATLAARPARTSPAGTKPGRYRITSNEGRDVDVVVARDAWKAITRWAAARSGGSDPEVHFVSIGLSRACAVVRMAGESRRLDVFAARIEDEVAA